MATWQEVRDLRKSGRPGEALQVARSELAESPANAQIRIQAEWASFDLIKEVVAKILKATEANAKPVRADLDLLYKLLRVYVGLKPVIPGMVASNILHQLANPKTKVGRQFEKFLAFLQKCGLDCLRPEDFQLKTFQGRVSSSSWAMGLAREAAAWIKARPNATANEVAFAVNLARTVQAQAKDTDNTGHKTWLDWDLALLLRRAGDWHAAAELIVGVLKRKRTESWAWAAAARIHREEQT